MAWSFLFLLSAMSANDAPGDPVKAPAWQKWLELVPPELRLEVKPLREEENAYPLWLEAGKAAVEIGDDDADLQEAFDGVLKADGVFPGGEGGEGLKKLLRENQKALDLVKAGIARGHLQLPQVVSGSAEEHPGNTTKILLTYRRLCYTKIVQAKKLAGDGEFGRAGDELLNILRFGEVISDGDAYLIHYLVGVAIQSIGLKGLQWLGARAPEQVVERLLGALQSRPAKGDQFAHALQVEFGYFFLRNLDEFPDQGKPGEVAKTLVKDLKGDGQEVLRKGLESLLEGHERPFDKPQTVRLAGDFFARLVKNAKLGWKGREPILRTESDAVLQVWPKELVPDIWGGDPEPVSSETLSKARAALKEIKNPAGKLVVATLFQFGGTSSSMEQAVRLEAEESATRLLLALRLYSLRKGRLPDSLEALVTEKIFPSLPMDSFSAKPFGYSREKLLLWSVGPKGDETGEKGALDEDGSKKQLVWPIHPAKL